MAKTINVSIPTGRGRQIEGSVIQITSDADQTAARELALPLADIYVSGQWNLKEQKAITAVVKEADNRTVVPFETREEAQAVMKTLNAHAEMVRHR